MAVLGTVVGVNHLANRWSQRNNDRACRLEALRARFRDDVGSNVDVLADRCGLDLYVLLGEWRGLGDQSYRSGGNVDRGAEQADQQQRGRRDVEQEAAGLELCRGLREQPGRSGDADMRRRRAGPAIPPALDRRRRLRLGRNAFTELADGAKDRESAFRRHLLNGGVVAYDGHTLAQPSRVVAQQLEVEAALPDARAHRQHEHRVLAVEAAQALDDLGKLFLGFNVNRVRCHGVYKSPGGLFRPLYRLGPAA